ncbi:transglutaminase domain-containing protein [Oryzobacter telluris]|uniref:transglutaminase family protein n=1 Tax=Oryzobacter telluris TaxID=3149179 RepID=UPI00370D949E
MRRYRIVHTTSLTYDSAVRAAHNELRMTPPNEAGQTTLENRIRIRPMTWSHVYRDHWGTHVMAMESLASHSQLDIEAISTVERTPVEPHEPSLDWSAVRNPAVQDRSYEWLMLSARTRPGAGIAELAHAVRGMSTPHEAATELARQVRAEMRYQRGVTGVHSRGEDAWTERAGVCQDFAHITIGALRSLGVPARYVSGYLVPKRDAAVGETSTGESHAWVEFWDDGWVAVDPTNGTEVSTDHVVVARGRDYEDVPPFKGIYSGRAVATLEVGVAITRLA